MNIKTIQRNNTSIAFVQSDKPIISDVQSALDLIATISYETGCYCIAINKAGVIEDFFKFVLLKNLTNCIFL